MKNFYVTFGQKSPFRDGYVLIEASDIRTAREEAFYALGECWSNIYEDPLFNHDMYPMGQIGKTLKPGGTTND